MQTPLQIVFDHVEDPEAARVLIEEKAAWLERFYDRITSCRVAVSGPHDRHRHGSPHLVRIDLSVPGDEIVVGREPARTGADALATAIRDAFDIARRQLEEYVRRMRKEGRRSEQTP